MQKTLKSYGSHVLWPDHCFRAYQMKTNAELLRKYLPSDLPGGIFTRSVVTFCRQLFYLHKTFHEYNNKYKHKDRRNLLMFF